MRKKYKPWDFLNPPFTATMRLFMISMTALALLLIVSDASGQEKHKISGKVTTKMDGEPIAGANIVIKGTRTGTISDVDGNFSIEASENDVLVVSFIGYLTEEIAVGSRTGIDITLSEDAKELSEVVVIGYGSVKKSDITGAVSSVTSEELTRNIGANLDQALKATAAGVTAFQTSGQPGSSVSIRIRGQSTLSANSAEPLYVIDGVPVQNVSRSGHDLGLGDRLGNGSVSTVSGLSGINPSDIQSIEILKDASATAIYGSRGANGVVLITTKRGKTGEAKFNYEGYYGIQDQVKRIDVMNLREYASYNTDWAAETSGRESRAELRDPSLLGEGTNWQDAIFQRAPMQSHQVSATGGTEKVGYFVSGSFFDQEGTVIGSDFSRFSSRINLDAQLKDWLKLGTNLTFSQTEENVGLNNSTEGIISIALRTSPDIAIYNTDGTWAGDSREGSSGSVNSIAKALDEENRLKRTSLLGTVFSDVTFVKGLNLRTELGVDLGYTNGYHFTPTYKYGNLTNNVNTASRAYNQNFFWQLKNYLTFNRAFGKHNITAMAGQEVSEWMYENLRGYSSDLASNDINEPSLGNSSTFQISSGRGSGAMASFFTRANYSFDDKYLATYTFRYDGSSNFGPKNRWAPFHAFALSWRVSGESFMQSVDNVIDNFKIRAGWGQTGNASIGGYRWGAAISPMNSNLGPGYRQSNIANPYIQWEKQEQWNLGVDLGFFRNRVELIVDLYDKTSSDMLMSMQLPSYMGTRGNESIRLNPPMGNFGKIQNKGVEFTLNTRPLVNEIEWISGLTFTMNRNKLLGLDGTPSAHIEGYGQWSDLVSLTEIGQPLYGFYGYVVDGMYLDKEDIKDNPKSEKYPADGNFDRSNTVWPGDLKFKDISGPNGVPDSLINSYDRTLIGSPLPEFVFGFNNTFNYKNFELNVFVSGSYGNKLLNYVGRSLSNMNSLWPNQLQIATNRAKLEPINADEEYPRVNSTGREVQNWFDDIDNVRVANPGTNIPRAISGDPNNNSRISDRYIEDGSYLRFQTISLAYNVPNRIFERIAVNSIRIYAKAQNLWTMTNYTGFDPEVGASQTGNNVYGMDNGRYPSPRVYTMGVNVSF